MLTLSDAWLKPHCVNRKLSEQSEKQCHEDSSLRNRNDIRPPKRLEERFMSTAH